MNRTVFYWHYSGFCAKERLVNEENEAGAHIISDELDQNNLIFRKVYCQTLHTDILYSEWQKSENCFAECALLQLRMND